MDLEIYNDIDAQEPTRLRLVKHDGCVTLCAVNKLGERLASGSLLKITEKGIYLCSSVDRTLGFDLTADGRLKVI